MGLGKGLDMRQELEPGVLCLGKGLGTDIRIELEGPGVGMEE
jgi:hypothetical protein